MNANEALREGARALRAASDEAAFESELLLRHALGLDRAHLYQLLREPLAPADEAAYRKLLERRLSHEPTPYIVGRKEFFGLDFEVTRAAIIPRPETETLVELAIAFVRQRQGTRRPSIVDVGTGSGAIAVSLAVNVPKASITAIDISEDALDLAARNARAHGVEQRISFARGDLLSPLVAAVDIIAANLPYVRTADWERLPPEIRDHEPRCGLDGGPDGLRVIARLLKDAPRLLRPGGTLFAEIGDEQGAEARRIASRAFPDAVIDVKPDLAGRDRVLVVLA